MSVLSAIGENFYCLLVLFHALELLYLVTVAHFEVKMPHVMAVIWNFLKEKQTFCRMSTLQ